MAKAALAKCYREAAYWTVKGGYDGPLPDGPIELDIKFYPPDARRRDLDNMLASIKSGIDGIADALEVNDQRFAFRISREAPTKGGKVVVSLL